MTDDRLNKLYPSSANVRKTGAKDGIEGLAQSIHNHGLLNNLAVQPGGEKETFSVLAGGRRLAALNHLAKAKLIPADWGVPCNVTEIEIEGDIPSGEISLAENEMRAAMHPADKFEAFKKLADEGRGGPPSPPSSASRRALWNSGSSLPWLARSS